MTTGLVESIRFTRVPGACEFCEHHDEYRITWTGAEGAQHQHHIYWCQHPLCSGGEPWQSFESLMHPKVLLTCWIPNTPTAVAVAYLLVCAEVRDDHVLHSMQARIGICDQWTDRQAGNVEGPGEPHKLFTERYFAESGPGVYRAEIVTAS